jgi:hypothetical protein
MQSRPAPGGIFPKKVDNLSRRARRLIVVVAYLSLPEAVIVFCLHGGVSGGFSPHSFGASSLEVLVLAQAGLAGAVLDRGWRAAIGARGLDERQRQLRDRAAYLSYRIVCAAVVIPVVVLWGATLVSPFDPWGPVTLDPTSLIALAVCVSVLCICLNVLPMAVVAWIEPDPPAEI